MKIHKKQVIYVKKQQQQILKVSTYRNINNILVYQTSFR